MKETSVYIRVSTDDQDPQRQWEDIREKYNVSEDNLYADIEHGDEFEDRKGYNDLMNDLEQFDTVIFDEMSRLGRSAREMRNTIDEMFEKGITIILHQEGHEFNPDDDSAMSGLFRDILTRLAEMELQQIRDRTQSGIRHAKRKGKHTGRPPTGYTTDGDGFLYEVEPTFTKVNEFVREVNKGRAKATTAKFFGLNGDSAQTILKNSKEYWEEDYIGDEAWRTENAKVKNGEKELEPLGDQNE